MALNASFMSVNYVNITSDLLKQIAHLRQERVSLPEEYRNMLASSYMRYTDREPQVLWEDSLALSSHWAGKYKVKIIPALWDITYPLLCGLVQANLGLHTCKEVDCIFKEGFHEWNSLEESQNFVLWGKKDSFNQQSFTTDRKSYS